VWRQQGILGGIFEGSFQISADSQSGVIIPSITGSAYVMAEGALLLDPDDPFRVGIAK
jgi:proline racemase